MKTVTVEGKWKGTVVLYDPQTLEQEAAYEWGLKAVQDAIEKGGMSGAVHAAILPAILLNVAEWKLSGFPENVTVKSFPTRPRKDRDELISLLIREISEIYKNDDPNE